MKDFRKGLIAVLVALPLILLVGLVFSCGRGPHPPHCVSTIRGPIC